VASASRERGEGMIIAIGLGVIRGGEDADVGYEG